MNWSADDSLDDNRDDNYSPNYGNYSPKSLLSRLVTAPARSWQCGVPHVGKKARGLLTWLLSGPQASSVGNKFGNKTR